MGAGKIVLVDTDIFIKVFRGDIKHIREINKLEGKIAISIISVLELYQGVQNRQRKYDLEKQIRAYRVLTINEDISSKALSLTRQYLPVKQLHPPDCFIAATALYHNLTLYTDNVSDFDFIKELKFYS